MEKMIGILCIMTYGWEKMIRPSHLFLLLLRIGIFAYLIEIKFRIYSWHASEFAFEIIKQYITAFLYPKRVISHSALTVLFPSVSASMT